MSRGGITRIELDAHRCQTVMHKITVKRVLFYLLQKRFDFFKCNRYFQNIVICGQNTILTLKCFTNPTSISKLRINLLLKNYVSL